MIAITNKSDQARNFRQQLEKERSTTNVSVYGKTHLNTLMEGQYSEN